MNYKSHGFRHEIQLGLALIILVLVILNIASHYALYRAKESLANRNMDILSEAAIKVTNHIYKDGLIPLDSEAESAITDEYDLKWVKIIPLYYETVLEIQKGKLEDSSFIMLGYNLKAKELIPVLQNRAVTLHHNGRPETVFLFPAEYIGSKYVIALSREDSLLSSIENAGKVLIFFGILGIAAILFISIKFVHLIVRPFERLREQAAQSGRLENPEGDEVSGLIKAYEKIICEMKANERELVRLNEMVQKRAADLEIYNNHILHSISSGIMTIDNNSRVTTINRSALSLLNSDEVSLLGKDYRESLRVYVGLYAILKKFNRGEKFSQVSVNLATRERRNRTVQISISRLKDTAGEDIGTAIILNDQTDYLKIRDELEINRRMAILGEMSGGLAHQLRNSAAAMVGLARLINRKSGEDGVLRDNSELLLKEAMETSELVSRFLDFSRPMHLESREFDVVALIEEIGHSLEGRFRNIYIEYDFKKAHPVTILGDQLLLKQAISNLADNACKALPQSGGKVNFSVWEEDEVVIITIKDNGRGIPDELKDKIFTPFISGSPSGTGLGLALAMKIVSIHGGHITFDSRRDQGTEFFVSLPYAAAGADAAARDKFAATT